MNQETQITAALQRAGLNTNTFRLRQVARDALEKHHGNIERSIPTFEKLIADDLELRREVLRLFLCDVFSESSDGSRPHHGTQKFSASPTNGGGTGQIFDEYQSPAAGPVREPSASQRAAAASVANAIAVTVLDTYRVRDGRAIGDVRFGELERLRSANAQEASLIRQIQRHAVADHDQRVRDVVKAEELNRMIQRAAEVADAA